MLELEQLVQLIHATPTRAVLAITGGGSGAISQLLEVPGASRTVLDAHVPYSQAALIEFLRATPEQYCDERTARALAMAAYQRAIELRKVDPLSDSPVVGIGCTASLASDRPKLGPHRFFVAWQSRECTVAYSVTLVKNRRTRAEEEALAATCVLNALAESCGLSERAASGLSADEPIAEARGLAEPAWQALWAGETDRICLDRGVVNLAAAPPRVIFPGAFDPLHAGHRRMLEIVTHTLGVEVAAEISIENVDKPLLDYVEIHQRASQFAQGKLWLTRAPTFVRKAELFPQVTFVVGADTIVRIAQPRYYGGAEACRAAIARLAELGCRFLVFGRSRAGQFETVDDLPLPRELHALCTAVSEREFREDISSSELRRRQHEPETE